MEITLRELSMSFSPWRAITIAVLPGKQLQTNELGASYLGNHKLTMAISKTAQFSSVDKMKDTDCR